MHAASRRKCAPAASPRDAAMVAHQCLRSSIVAASLCWKTSWCRPCQTTPSSTFSSRYFHSVSLCVSVSVYAYVLYIHCLEKVRGAQRPVHRSSSDEHTGDQVRGRASTWPARLWVCHCRPAVYCTGRRSRVTLHLGESTAALPCHVFACMQCSLDPHASWWSGKAWRARTHGKHVVSRRHDCWQLSR